MVFFTALLLLFFRKMPTKVWPRYAAKGDGRANEVGNASCAGATCPRRFFAMVYALGAICGLMFLAGNTIPKSAPTPISTYLEFAYLMLK